MFATLLLCLRKTHNQDEISIGFDFDELIMGFEKSVKYTFINP